MVKPIIFLELELFSMDNDFTQSQGQAPESLSIETKKSRLCSNRLEKDYRRMERSGRDSRGMDDNKSFLMEGVYKIVLDKLKLTAGWTKEAEYIKEFLI